MGCLCGLTLGFVIHHPGNGWVEEQRCVQVRLGNRRDETTNVLTHEENGRVGAVLSDLGHPLRRDVVKGDRRDDAEAEDEYIRLRVAQGPETVVVFLRWC